MAFTARSNSFCSDALTVISKLTTPDTPLRQIQYATDRYTALEKTVSELTDASLPGGTTGDALRQRWLRPARAALDHGRLQLQQLRDAVHSDDTTGAREAFATARNVGLQGVDTALLRASGLDRCATLFTPTPST
jgi:hypothetical protein